MLFIGPLTGWCNGGHSLDHQQLNISPLSDDYVACGWLMRKKICVNLNANLTCVVDNYIVFITKEIPKRLSLVSDSKKTHYGDFAQLYCHKIL